MDGEIAPYKSRPKLLVFAQFVKAMSLPIVLIPIFLHIVVFQNRLAIPFFAFSALAILLISMESIVRNVIANGLFKRCALQDRLFVNVSACYGNARNYYTDDGVLWLDQRMLCFEGVDSSFLLPISMLDEAGNFEDDGTFAALHLSTEVSDIPLYIRIRQYNCNNPLHRLSDVRRLILDPSVKSDSVAIFPPRVNNETLRWPFRLSTWLSMLIGVVALSVVAYRTLMGIPSELTLRESWITVSFLVLLGVGVAILDIWKMTTGRRGHQP